ncbi:GNAT family N-acetyltransferase [Ekhidna sp.]|uniref:GNAT family N-acetyltransferase n=1 Tax=Ekhidna sp. TaxID=2608089 RepID=UPI003CCBA222
MGEEWKVIRLDQSSLKEAHVFLERIFTQEQHIPKHLIPPPSNEQRWWCIRKNDKIIATVAAWKIKNEWHWGRLAVDPNERGHGWSKKIAHTSFKELFESGIGQVIIDARDITVHLLKSIGAEITGPTDEFYGFPITPMLLRKDAFDSSINA